MITEQRADWERRQPISVVVVDDDALVRHALTALLTAEGFLVAGMAGTAEEAIGLVVELQPDVVLMDLRLPSMSGVDATERLGLLAPDSRILVLSGSADDLVVEAIVAGASGYILKGADPDAITAAVRATAADETVLSPAIASKLLGHIRLQGLSLVSDDELAGAAIRAALTPRELQIFTRLASGDSNHDIGRDLALSPSTVSNHVASILEKLHLDNRVQAAVHAVRSGIS